MLTTRNTALAKPQTLIPSVTDKKRIEQKRMDDVLLLLENLVDREEATVKLILDCLYDVGSVNLIDKKFPRRPVNGIIKYIARLSKPAFKVVAFRWFRKNSPQLITNWLYKKIKF
ncbi:hypothetical protein [Gloeothece verrucosa]|uniref:Uncharacterized protein n=1 Tax=Gloeothece verrucosa (strain PCC 7822) TaxID=497965 RepID=E0UI96_GLOV7|nr:hypothetical protein [Gloeothece verrucosa]ADN16864.1 conserved hypothetical protein [Gloeothece verrucosa PCC 7822]